MVKTLLVVFTNGKNIKIVRVKSNGATSVELSGRKTKHIVTNADTNFGFSEVDGYIILDSFFE